MKEKNDLSVQAILVWAKSRGIKTIEELEAQALYVQGYFEGFEEGKKIDLANALKNLKETEDKFVKMIEEQKPSNESSWFIDGFNTMKKLAIDILRGQR